VRCLGAICLLAGCFSKPARPVDGDADGPPGGDGPTSAAKLTHVKNASNNTASSVTYPIATEPSSVLFVTVQLGGNCAPGGPNVQAVMAEATPMVRVDQIVGLPGCNDNSKTELWQLVDPPVAALLQITVALDGTAASLHSAAFDFVGVDRQDPVRATSKMSGDSQSLSSSVTIDSEPGDLVFDVIGQGNHINQPGATQTQLFDDNHGNTFTLDNTAASTKVGLDVTVMTWEFGGPDFWQSMAVALRPAP
jgi:hypothetical protein